jgi:DNA invertase Pin-like site-specific DNA recombinase
MAAYKGSRHHFSKITEEDARLILELDQERRKVKKVLDTLSQRAIAEKFGISKQRVWEICNARDGAWGHVWH